MVWLVEKIVEYSIYYFLTYPGFIPLSNLISKSIEEQAKQAAEPSAGIVIYIF